MNDHNLYLMPGVSSGPGMIERNIFFNAENGGHIKAGDIALLRTDWDRKEDIGRREFWTRAPYTTREAATWLCTDPPGWRPGKAVVACT